MVERELLYSAFKRTSARITSKLMDSLSNLPVEPARPNLPRSHTSQPQTRVAQSPRFCTRRSLLRDVTTTTVTTNDDDDDGAAAAAERTRRVN